MTDKTIERVYNNYEDLTKETEKNLENFTEKNQTMINELQRFTSELPYEAQAFILDQQEKIRDVNTKLMNSFQTNPMDWQNASLILSNFQAEQFSTYLKAVNKHNQQLQNLLLNFNQTHIIDTVKSAQKSAVNMESKIQKNAKK